MQILNGKRNMRDLLTGLGMGLAISLALFGPMLMGST